MHDVRLADMDGAAGVIGDLAYGALDLLLHGFADEQLARLIKRGRPPSLQAAGR